MSTYRWNELGLGIVFICSILIAGCENQANNADGRGVFFKSAGADLRGLPGNVIEDSGTTFSRSDNLIAILAAGGVSVIMNNTEADDKLATNFERHRAFKGFSDESLYTIGGPGAHFALTGLWYAVSVQNGDEFNKERAWTMMRALSVTGAVTVGLKAARNNHSPNGAELAWPSGHTASSFTVASVLDEFYGPQVGIPAYTLASVVAWRMMDTGDHWGSDVVFGVTLGWVVGHTIAGEHRKLEIAGFRVLPYIAEGDRSVTGVSLVKQF